MGCVNFYQKYVNVFKKNGITKNPYCYDIEFTGCLERRESGLLGEGVFFTHTYSEEGYTTIKWYSKNVHGANVLDAILDLYLWLSPEKKPFDLVIIADGKETEYVTNTTDEEIIQTCLSSKEVEVKVYHNSAEAGRSIKNYIIDFEYIDNEDKTEYFKKINKESNIV